MASNLSTHTVPHTGLEAVLLRLLTGARWCSKEVVSYCFDIKQLKPIIFHYSQLSVRERFRVEIESCELWIVDEYMKCLIPGKGDSQHVAHICSNGVGIVKCVALCSRKHSQICVPEGIYQ